jgi:hypothetical protein
MSIFPTDRTKRALGPWSYALLAAVWAAASWIAPPAFADEPTRGGEIWLPQLSAPAKIKVEQATVELGLSKEDGPWSGQIVLQIKNPTKAAQTIELNLPERPCNGAEEVCNGRDVGRYDALSITVDGETIVPAVVTQAEEVAWWPSFGKVFRWPVTLAARATVLLEIRWNVAQTIDGDGTFATIRGVAAWRKYIKALDIAIALPDRPWTLGHPAELKLVSYDTRIGGVGALQGKPETRIDLRARGWKSEEPVVVHIGTANRLGGAMRCPDPRAIADASRATDGAAQLQRLLVMRNDNELQACRALYLARQGFGFSDKEMQSRFYGKPLRSASVTDTVLEGKVRPFLRYGMQPNPRYTTSLHNASDSAMIDALAVELRRRKGQ